MKYLQIKKSIVDEIPSSIKFGELAISDKDNILRLYAGDQLLNPIKIFDQSLPATNFVYNNDKHKTVAIGGSDSNNGQSGYPLETITYATSQITSGGAVVIEGGLYNEDLLFDGAADSRKAILGTPTTSNYNVTEFQQSIQIINNNAQMTFGYIEFSYAGIKCIDILSTASNSNYNFQNITVSNSTAEDSYIVYVDNMETSAGYISLDGCDFLNRILYLKDSTLPRFCYITNSRNISLHAGTNWIVVVDDASTVQELTNNNNIITSNTVNDIITAAPSTFGFYLLENDITISSVVYPKGSLIVFNGVTVSYTTKYYRNASAYYVINKNQTYVKTGSSEYKPVTSYPIVL